MKYVASISFGKDSLAMLLRLIEEHYPLDIVVFYNTGMEFEAIYRIRDKVVPWLERQGIEYVELNPSRPFLYSMLERPVFSIKGIKYGYGWCGGLCRWGTSEKLRAIKKFKRSLKESVIDYVGIACDETHRFDKAKNDGKRMPLVEWGMTEQDCLDYCHSKGWFWLEETASGMIELYSILDRVSCWCCCNKNLKELKNIYVHLPAYWEMLKSIQSQLKRPFKGYYKDQPKGIFELEERFKKEINES